MGDNAGFENEKEDLPPAVNGKELQEAPTKGNKVRSFEDVLHIIRPFGMWQVWVYFWLFVFVIQMAFIPSSISFIQLAPDFVCDNAGPNHENYTQLSAIPKTRLNNCSASDGSKCTKFKYFPTSMYTTIVTEWDLICDKKLWVQHSQVVYMFGVCIGRCSGLLSDRVGRKTILIIAQVSMCILSFAHAFAPTLISFLIVRFFLAIAIGCIFVPTFVLGSEITTAKYRAWICGAFWSPYSLGATLTAVIFWALRDWRTVHFVVAFPLFLAFANIWLLPESPRWLMVVGKVERAKKVFNWATSWNSVTPPESFNFEEAAKAISDEAHRERAHHVSILTVFKYPKVLGLLCISFYCWFAAAFIFYGMSMNVARFGSNPFISVGLVNAVGIPGWFSATILLRVFGRKKSYCAVMLFGSVALICIAWIPEDMAWLSIGLAMVGSMASSCSWGLIYVYSSEIFPTVLRTAAMGISGVGANMGGMIAPYVADTGKLAEGMDWLGPVIFGLTAIPAALLVLIPPETKGRKLPDHLEDIVKTDLGVHKMSMDVKKFHHHSVSA